MITSYPRGRAILRLLSFDNRPERSTEPNVGGKPARVPPGVCVYAIGDIHGRADLLEALHRKIATDAEDLTPGTEKFVIYLGDYVDRGFASRQVLDLLVRQPLKGFNSVHLLGNHDAWLLSFLRDARIGTNWLDYGGNTTIHSYGVRPHQPVDDLQEQLRERMPRSHVEFLRTLKLRYEVGDYLFVHAGVNPAAPLDRQDPEDLLGIRELFLTSDRDVGKVVVHGHTIEAQPTVRANRIGIDTGAYRSGCLTCLVLEEANYRFLDTDPFPPPSS